MPAVAQITNKTEKMKSLFIMIYLNFPWINTPSGIKI